MSLCVHCDEVVLAAFYGVDDPEKKNPFCCHGCLTVFNILHLKGLDSYYEIKQQSSLFKRRSPVEVQAIGFQYLDDLDFLNEYSYRTTSDLRAMEFYLEGIHCLACLWLIEKIPEFLNTVLLSKLNLERSVVVIVLKSGGKFSEVARELNNLGYRPHPLKENQDSSALKLREERSALTRIGVAGAAAGNIMIYAVSLYGGAADTYAQLFNLLTVLFAVPVLTYCAFPLYRNAYSALKNKSLSIDIPISVALLMGAALGVYNFFAGIPENYFDSLTTLVFLLLMSRYFLQKIQEKGLSAQDLHFFYQSESVLRANPDGVGYSEIHPRFIRTNDVLKIRAGEFIPADGVVLHGSSNLNNSLLTGESAPVKVSSGERIYSGTQNLDQELVIRADKIQTETRLGGILKNVENGWAHQSRIVDLTEEVSKYFTLVVFLLSFTLFLTLYFKGDTRYAFEQAITLLIVTCPCALALAIPLTFTRALSKASKQGIIIKSDEVIEKLSKVETIFFDKTGTITHGKPQITQFELLREPKIPIEDIISLLESKSRHHTARALMEFIKGKSIREFEVKDQVELLGWGVSGKIEGSFYEIHHQGIFEDGKKIATFQLSDTVRSDSKEIITNLKQNFIVGLLSGDRSEVVQVVALEVGLSRAQVYAEISPEEKCSIIKRTRHSMMVGDGANDAIALGQADVGVAVLGAMDISLRAADVYLTTPGLESVEKLLILSRETMKVIHRNIGLSLIYNSVSVTAVFLGFISPLVAAIIMPLSSLTVLMSTIIGTKKLRLLWRS